MATQEGGRRITPRHAEQLYDVLTNLLEWETTVGGWEAEIWKRARDLRTEIQDEDDARDDARDAAIRAMVETSDELEVDEDAVVSEGDDNGAFVAAWVWVSFHGTELDKTKEEEADEDAAADGP